MKLYLLKDAELTLKPHHRKEGEDEDEDEIDPESESHREGDFWVLNSAVQTNLEPLDAQESFQDEFCQALKARLESSGIEEVTAGDDDDRAKKKVKKSMDWNVSLGMQMDHNNYSKDSVKFFINGLVLYGLQISMPEKRVTVKVTMKDFVEGKDVPPRHNNNALRWGIAQFKDFISASTKEMEIVRKKKWAGCCDDAVKVPPFLSQHWYESFRRGRVFEEASVTGKFTVILTFHNFNQDYFFFPTTDMQRKVLENGLGTDITLLSGDKEKFRCHKYILAVNSPVLERILTCGFEEAHSGIIETPHLTSEGLKAFISFLYYRDRTAVLDNPLLAMELLEAGEKYDILHLKKAMAISLTRMDEENWTADFALRLYLFAGKIDLDGSAEGLKRKTMGVMKKNATDVKDSEEFEALFKNEPRIAMELFHDMCKEEPRK